MVGEASIRLDSPTALQQPCFLSSKYKFWIDTGFGLTANTSFGLTLMWCGAERKCPKVAFAAHAKCVPCKQNRKVKYNVAEESQSSPPVR